MRFASRIYENLQSLIVARVLWLLVVAASTGGQIQAQLPLHTTLVGSPAATQFGSAVAGVGDIDGDGADDFAIGHPSDTSGGLLPGLVRVYSGQDYHVIFSLNSAGSDSSIGQSLAGLGDVDLDGVPDFVMGSTNSNSWQGLLRVYSGADASVIHNLTAWPIGVIGRSVNCAGDVNSDGIPDIIGGGNGGAAVYSGADGTMLHLLSGLYTVDNYGHTVRGLGDVDGDGVDDFAVSAPGYSGSNLVAGGFGRVYVYSGATGQTIWALQTGILGGGFGLSIAAPGDINGDGRADILVGSAAENNNDGAVRLISGLDASVIRQWSGPVGLASVFGAVDYAGDMDGDGIGEVIIGALGFPNGFSNSNSGKFYVYPIDSTVPILSGVGSFGDRLGIVVAGLGDINGDGFNDVAVTATFDDANGFNTGTVYIYSVGGVRRYADTGTGIQTLDLNWYPGAGSDPADGLVECTGASPFAFGVYGVSFEAWTATISGFPVVIDLNPSLLFISTPISFDATGTYTAPSMIRHPFVGGITVRAQFFALSGAAASSNGLELRLVK